MIFVLSLAFAVFRGGELLPGLSRPPEVQHGDGGARIRSSAKGRLSLS